jgi:hypothetical protein
MRRLAFLFILMANDVDGWGVTPFLFLPIMRRLTTMSAHGEHDDLRIFLSKQL